MNLIKNNVILNFISDESGFLKGGVGDLCGEGMGHM